MTLDYKAIDVDNHYYETLDSCTRHLPKEFKRRGVQMVQDGKRTWAVMGEKVNHFIPNPTFDPIIEPGCLDLLFRGEIPEGVDPASLMKVDRLGEHPEYQNRDARVKILDRQNLETVFMLPTFACGVEEALKHDVEATMATVHAFNLWLDEDWGFDRPDHRIISAPIISLADPDKAVEEVEFVLAAGAKMVLVRPAPPSVHSLGILSVRIECGHIGRRNSAFLRHYLPLSPSVPRLRSTVRLHSTIGRQPMSRLRSWCRRSLGLLRARGSSHARVAHFFWPV